MSINTSRIRVWVQKMHDRANLSLQWHEPETNRRLSKSAGTDDPKAAEQMAKDLEYELNHGARQQPAKMTWEQFRKVYAVEKLAGNREATRKKGGAIFESFGQQCRPKNLAMVTTRMVTHYATLLRAANRSAATIHGHLSYLKAALRWAVKQGFLLEAPQFTMPKLNRKTNIRTITKEEFERLLAACPDERWRAFLWTGWLSGMRRTEMLDLHWQEGSAPWVDFGQRRIWIPAAHNKAGVDQWMPLHPELTTVLVPLREARGRLFRLGANPSAVSAAFRTIAKRAGIRATLHDLRRSFGSRLALKVPAAVLQQLMRHSDIKTTLGFYINVGTALDDAILNA